MRQSQQTLRRHDDERPPLAVPALTPEEVKVLGWRRAVGHPDVPLGGQLEEPLDPGARVLRTLALVSMRQQQGQPGRQSPLGEPGHKELVYDHLGAVDEVAKLCFPQHQNVVGRGAVAILEPEASLLGERAVVDLDRGQGATQVLHGRERVARLGVVKDQVSLAERSPLGVLAREPNGNPFRDEGC